jgi:hypothetical protein
VRQDPSSVARAAGAGAAERAGAIRVPRWAYPLVTIASLLIGGEAIVRGTRLVTTAADSDLTNFFFRSADYILNGRPFQMYAVHASGGYPNYNPPLSIFLMAPLLGLARALGFAANYGEQITFVSLPFTLFVPLLGYLALRALRQFYPQMPDAQRFLAYALVVLSPLTWQSYSPWYHIEQPMMLCLLVAALLALQARREGLAGVLAGLAVLTRTTALMPLLALGVLLLVGREWRTLVRFGGIAAAIAAAGIAPFFLVDRAGATYAFLSWRGTAIIGGNSIWTIFAAPDDATGIRHTVDALARRLDMPSVVIFLVIVAVVAAMRRRVSAFGRDAWAVAAIAALAVPMLSKTNWPYYYLEPFIFLLIWEFASMHDRLSGVWRWPVLSVVYLATTATLSQYIWVQSVGALDRILVGVTEFVVMAAFAYAIWRRMAAAKASVASAQPPRLATQAAAPPVGPGGVAPRRPAPGVAARPVPAELPPAVPLWPGEAPRSQSVRVDEPLWTAETTMPGRSRPSDPSAAVPPGGSYGAPPAGPRSRPSTAGEQWPDLDSAWPRRPPTMGDR